MSENPTLSLSPPRRSQFKTVILWRGRIGGNLSLHSKQKERINMNLRFFSMLGKQEFNWRKFCLSLTLSIIAILTGLMCGMSEIVGAVSSVSDNWIGAWTTPQAPFMEGMSKDGFENITLRQIVHPLSDGSKVRIKLSNLFGIKAVTFNSVHVALQDVGANILPGTDKKVTFKSGQSTVTILPGVEVWSDPIDLQIVDNHNLAVSLYIAKASGPATWHFMAMQTNYISNSGDYTADIQASEYVKTMTSWFWLAEVEVMANEAVKGTLVCLGDSITEGDLSTIDANKRWPDYLAERIRRESPQYQLAVLNQGLGGNRLLTFDAQYPRRGISALDRLEHDVLQQNKLKAVILLEGINDISSGCHDADKIIAGMKEIIKRVHAKGAKIYGGTLTPFAVTKAYTPQGEMTREKVNNWIRTSGTFDGVIDFDQVLRDPKRPLMMLPKYDSGDHIHPNDAGYEAMANAVDLNILKF
jgi:lysophospholipase L1-like esterase